MRAARAYQSIVQSINQAEAAAKKALKTAEDTVRIVCFSLLCELCSFVPKFCCCFSYKFWFGPFLDGSIRMFLSTDIMFKKYCCDLVCVLFVILSLYLMTIASSFLKGMYTAILETQNALQLNNTRSMKITQRKKNQ